MKTADERLTKEAERELTYLMGIVPYGFITERKRRNFIKEYIQNESINSV